VLAASAKEISQEAKVVATGPGRVTDQGMRIPMELRVGDRVLVRRYAGVEIEVEGQELILVRESEILGTIT
jgi:chaperonin GroES